MVHGRVAGSRAGTAGGSSGVQVAGKQKVAGVAARVGQRRPSMATNQGKGRAAV